MNNKKKPKIKGGPLLEGENSSLDASKKNDDNINVSTSHNFEKTLML